MPGLQDNLPVIVTSAELGGRPERAVAAKTAQRIVRGLYTTNTKDPIEQVVRKNLWDIIARLVPDALITDRSGGPSVIANDTVYVVSSERTRDVDLPGMRIAVRAGLPAREDDPVWMGGLRKASIARSLAENLAPSRGRAGRPARTLSDDELAQWLAVLTASHTPERLGRIRDRARELATVLGTETRWGVLDEMFATLGRTASTPRPGLLSAMASGSGWDTAALGRFDALADQMAGGVAGLVGDVSPTQMLVTERRSRHAAFFEAYCSNFIEGTEFDLDEAIDIVYTGVVPDARPEDAHDITGTYELIADEDERSHTVRDGNDLVATLVRWHTRLMSARPNVRPGQFKTRANRVGSYTFVAPELAEGTLIRATPFRDRIADPLGRAAFMMFVVAEVHPFDDGNGRLARLVANAELSSAGQHRIIVPIILRNDYLNGLRRLSTASDPGLFIRVLARAWALSAQIDFSDMATARADLARANALTDAREAERDGIHLYLPAELDS